MNIEHIALNVTDSAAAAQWYVEHLGMKIIREVKDERNVIFLADSAGTGRIEFYNNPAAAVLNYHSVHPLMLHIAFVVEDIQAEIDRLVAAGAEQFAEIEHTPGGDQLVFLRDPWGMCIQLVKRREPM